MSSKRRHISRVSALVSTVVLLSACTYMSSGYTDPFVWQSVSPLGIVQGFVFALSFGLGLATWLSISIALIMLLVLWLGFVKLFNFFLR